MAKDALTDEMQRTQLHRERRLVLAVSVVLLAHQILGIDISNDAESLGLRFQVNNPQRVWTAVWFLWLWAFVRYSQVLYSFGPASDYPRNQHNALWHRICQWLIVRRVRR
jgi:hypothetical protein